MADFVDGLMAKKPNEKAPDFVKCAISIKRADLITWLTGQTAEVDTWKPRSE